MTPKTKEQILKEEFGTQGGTLKGWMYMIPIESAMDKFAKQETQNVFLFSQWASHSDWTFLPSKNKWYNEEDEENITPLTTEQLYTQFTEHQLLKENNQ